MESQTLCKAQYRHGRLVYVITVLREEHDVDWEKEREVTGERYLVEYVEETLPSKNRVGGLETLEDALGWVNSQFGQLKWSYISKE